MLSGEGNENGEKTTIGLISKKATLHVQHTFFVYFFAVVLHDYDVKLPETSQLHNFWRKRRFLVHFFNAAHFHLALVAASICHYRYKISNKKKNVSFVFLSLALDLCLPFTR